MAGVLQQRDFRMLWGGQFVSDFGRQLSLFAFPTIAILALHARAELVTTITACEYAVVPLFALVAGVLVDRWRRRPTMIAANAVRLLALASLPIAALLHVLGVAHLLVVATIVSLAGLFFDTAYQPFLTHLVGREAYARGNARMTLSANVAVALGNGLGGPIVSALGAPLALVANIGTYLVGTAALIGIRKPEVRAAVERRSFRAEFVEGCAIVARDRLLRGLAGSTALLYLGGTIVDGVLPLYAYRGLHATPAAFGCMLSLASAGVIGGAFVQRFPRTALVAMLPVAVAAIAAGDALCTLAVAPFAGIVIGRALVAAAAPAYEIAVQTIATERVADHQLARMNASLRTLTNATIPAGALAAGFAVAHVGFTIAIAAGAGIIAVAALGLAFVARSGRSERCSLSTTTISSLPSAA